MTNTEFLEYILQNLVKHPEDVEIREILGEDETVVEVRVNEDDIGKVIGKSGSVARALRTLLTAKGIIDQKNYCLEIID